MLKGTLDDFSLADIFKLLSFSKKTGRIELKRKAGMGRVFFRDGDVYFAESSLSREPLGQKLIRSRALSESHLRQALDEHAESGERVGQILLRQGWIDEEQLEFAVRQQIEDSVFDLLRWELGDFEWELGATLEPEVPISVSVENLIMESSRRLDELEIIGRKVPSSQAVVAVAATPPEGAVEINITPDEWRVLVLVDGHRTVETIANTIGLDEFQTMRIVHGMVSAGLIEVVGADEGQAQFVSPPPPPPEDIGAVLAPPPPPATGVQEDDEQVETVDDRDAVQAVDAVDDDEADANDEADAAEETPSYESFSEEPEQRVDEDLDLAVSDFFSDERPAAEETFSPVAEEPFELPDMETIADEPATAEAPVPEEAMSDPVGLPAGDDVVEETLFEANTAEVQAEGEAPSPPEEWFADPDLSMDLFDRPSPGDLLTELPSENGEAAATEEFSELMSDDVDTQQGDEPEAPVEPKYPRTPPPPPVPQVEGAERTRAVRELSDLFDETEPVERTKRPVLRRIEPTDETNATKRRVEDDEQVTKSLISRLIEGVKGL